MLDDGPDSVCTRFSVCSHTVLLHLSFFALLSAPAGGFIFHCLSTVTEITFSGSLHFRNGDSLHNCILDIELLLAQSLSSCVRKTSEEGDPFF